MDIDAIALAEEVQSLWQQKALRGPWLRRRPYPQVLRVCRINEQDKLRRMAAKVAKTIKELIGDHQADTALLLTALGLRAEAPQASLRGRLTSLARERHEAGERFVAYRTMRRQLDGARDRFVQAAVADARASSAADQVGHVVEAFHQILDLTGDRVKITVRRRIRVTRDRLDAIHCSFGLPQPPQPGSEARFTINVVSGGLGCDRVEWRGGAVHYYVELWQPLDAGQVHEFEVSYQLPPGLPIERHCVIQPKTPFEEYELTMCFDPCRLPDRVWKVEGVTHREIDDCPGSENVLTLDPSGRVRVRFLEIHTGSSYGIAWEWK